MSGSSSSREDTVDFENEAFVLIWLKPPGVDLRGTVPDLPPPCR